MRLVDTNQWGLTGFSRRTASVLLKIFQDRLIIYWALFCLKNEHALQFSLEFSPSVCFGGWACRGRCNNKRFFAWVRIHVAGSMSQSSNLENSASTTPWDTNAQEKGAVDHQGTHLGFNSTVRPVATPELPSRIFLTNSINWIEFYTCRKTSWYLVVRDCVV